VKNGQCFSGQHPFAGFTYGGSCVSRSVMTVPRLPSAFTFASLLQTSFYSAARPAIEAYHNSLHNWVGNTMSVVPTSPADPVFFLHHAFVDQVFAAWQTCNGYGTGAQPLASFGWDTSFSWWPLQTLNFGDNMPGFGAGSPAGLMSAQQAWNLVGQFNVRYASTWVNAGFSSSTCPLNNRQFLASMNPAQSAGTKVQHLFGHSNLTKQFHLTRGHFNPSTVTINQEMTVHETFKDALTVTQNIGISIQKATLRSCLMLPILTDSQAQLFTQEFITRMHFEDECAAGYCVDACWNITRHLLSS